MPYLRHRITKKLSSRHKGCMIENGYTDLKDFMRGIGPDKILDREDEPVFLALECFGS